MSMKKVWLGICLLLLTLSIKSNARKEVSCDTVQHVWTVFGGRWESKLLSVLHFSASSAATNSVGYPAAVVWGHLPIYFSNSLLLKRGVNWLSPIMLQQETAHTFCICSKAISFLGSKCQPQISPQTWLFKITALSLQRAASTFLILSEDVKKIYLP